MMTSKERFFALLAGENADRPAVINPVSAATTESVEALGLRFSRVHTDAYGMAALARYTHDEIGFDSILPYFSVVAEAAALGAEIQWGDNRTMPTQRGTVFQEPEEVRVPPGFLDRPTTRSLLEAIGLLHKSHGDRAVILGKAMGPWTLCMHLYGVENTLVDSIDAPEKLSAMLTATAAFTALFTRAQLEAGAQMVTVADHCTSNLIGPQVYDRFVRPLHQRLNALYPGKLILHCCGNTEDRVHLFARGGFALYHFESSNSIPHMLERAGDLPLTGCVDNPTVLLRGGPDDVYRHTADILRAGIRILSPECAVPMPTPNANLRAIVACAREVHA